jgi:uncharacterized membrane protein YtjA (UPF0391 family)
LASVVVAVAAAISPHGTNRDAARSAVEGWRRLGFLEIEMIYWGLVFFIVAIMATAFGLGGMAASSAGVAQLLIFMLTAVFALSLLAGVYRRVR